MLQNRDWDFQSFDNCLLILVCNQIQSMVLSSLLLDEDRLAWRWSNDGIPTIYDREIARSTLTNYKEGAISRSYIPGVVPMMKLLLWKIAKISQWWIVPYMLMYCGRTSIRAIIYGMLAKEVWTSLLEYNSDADIFVNLMDLWLQSNLLKDSQWSLILGLTSPAWSLLNICTWSNNG